MEEVETMGQNFQQASDHHLPARLKGNVQPFSLLLWLSHM